MPSNSNTYFIKSVTLKKYFYTTDSKFDQTNMDIKHGAKLSGLQSRLQNVPVYIGYSIQQSTSHCCSLLSYCNIAIHLISGLK